MFSLVGTIADAIEALYAWAIEETNNTKKICKSFVAGFIDGWEYGCLIVGNVVCISGLILMTMKPFLKKNILWMTKESAG